MARAMTVSETEASKEKEANCRMRSAGVMPKAAGLGEDEVGEAAVGDEDALGAAGGAGGVDDIGEVVRGGCGRRVGWRARVRRPGGRSRSRQRSGARAGLQPGPGIGEMALWVRTRRDAGVGEHELQAVGRVGGIEGQVGGAGLEGGEEGDDHVEGAREGDADEGFGADAAGDEPVGQVVGAGVELGVGEALRVGCAGRCDGTKTAAGASGVRAAQSLEEGVDGVVGQGGGGGVPGGELGRSAAVSRGRSPMGVSGWATAAASRVWKWPIMPRDRGRIEQVHVVLERPRSPARRVFEPWRASGRTWRCRCRPQPAAAPARAGPSPRAACSAS